MTSKFQWQNAMSFREKKSHSSQPKNRSKNAFYPPEFKASRLGANLEVLATHLTFAKFEALERHPTIAERKFVYQSHKRSPPW